jgi:hypothetical protein
MTFEVIISIIAKYLLLPIASGLFGAGVKNWIENRRLFKLSPGRKVQGRWAGEIKYSNPRWDSETVEIEFYGNSLWRWLNPKLIKGRIHSAEGPNEDLLMRGGFYREDQLMLDYRSAQAERKQFGSVLLQLSSDARQLRGNFIGYFDGVTTGSLTVSKRV